MRWRRISGEQQKADGELKRIAREQRSVVANIKASERTGIGTDQQRTGKNADMKWIRSALYRQRRGHACNCKDWKKLRAGESSGIGWNRTVKAPARMVMIKNS